MNAIRLPVARLLLASSAAAPGLDNCEKLICAPVEEASLGGDVGIYRLRWSSPTAIQYVARCRSARRIACAVVHDVRKRCDGRLRVRARQLNGRNDGFWPPLWVGFVAFFEACAPQSASSCHCQLFASYRQSQKLRPNVRLRVFQGIGHQSEVVEFERCDFSSLSAIAHHPEHAHEFVF